MKKVRPFKGSGWLLIGIFLLLMSMRGVFTQPAASTITAVVGGLMVFRYTVQHGMWED